MSDILATARDHFLQALHQAEKASFQYLLEYVREDIGPELAPHLDSTFCSTHSGVIFPEHNPNPDPNPFPFRLNSKYACVIVRIPECTEIVLQYARDGKSAGGSTSNLLISNCRCLEWRALEWNRSYSSKDKNYGKFGVVRYCINKSQQDAARVEPGHSHLWHCTNNAKSAKIVAAEFKKEKDNLLQEVEHLIRAAQEDLKRITAGGVRE